MRSVDERQAGRRYTIITLTRFAGLLVLMAGLCLALGNNSQSPWLGYAVVLLGMAGFFGAPKLLARRWRTPKQ